MADLLMSTERELSPAVDALIADGDESALLDALAGLPDLVRSLLASPEDRFDTVVPIINAAAVAAIALRRGKLGVAHAALDALKATYAIQDPASDNADDETARFYEGFAGALWAFGAVACELGDWDTLTRIIRVQPVEGGHYKTWLRHDQVIGARASTDPADDNVLNIGLGHLRLHPGFGMSDIDPAAREQHLAGFDFLAVVVIAQDDGPMAVYPSYAKYSEERIEHLAIDLRRPGDLRAAAFPGANEELRKTLRVLNEVALLQAAQFRKTGRSWAYRGFQDARTLLFIREGNMWEDWPR